MTKLEQHTDTDRSDHARAKAQLRRALRRTDSENRLSGRELAETVPVSESTVRDLLQELRREGLPVWSNGHGYYVIQDGEELDSVIESIRDEIATKEQTMTELCKAFNQS
jgi:biotin operon repressor